MNLFTLLRPVVVLLVAVGLVTLSSRASAEERDYRTHSTAMFINASGDFVAAGNGTHLGNYTESGNVVISGTDVAGSATLTDKHGNELYVSIAGDFNPLTGTITGEISFEGGEGRFEGATGSAIVVAQIQADGTIAVVVEGTIDY